MPLKLICASHTPLMDHVEADPSVDAKVREHFHTLAQEVRDYDPELIIVFAPDHFKGIFYNMLPPFTIGIRATSIGDYDIGGGEFNVPEDLALDCVRALHAADVDVSLSYRLQADHGFAQLLVLLAETVDRYPALPIHVNCVGVPLPPFKRVRMLGQAVGQWAAGLQKRVLVLGSGGLSHDPPMPQLKTAPPQVVERLIEGYAPSLEERREREEQNYATARALARGEGDARPLAPDWDKRFLDQMQKGELAYLDGVSEDELTARAGCGGNEVRAWVAAYSALAAIGPYRSEIRFYHDIAEWNAGMGITVAATI